jgi:hypothetical protein
MEEPNQRPRLLTKTKVCPSSHLLTSFQDVSTLFNSGDQADHLNVDLLNSLGKLVLFVVLTESIGLVELAEFLEEPGESDPSILYFGGSVVS